MMSMQPCHVCVRRSTASQIAESLEDVAGLCDTAHQERSVLACNSQPGTRTRHMMLEWRLGTATKAEVHKGRQVHMLWHAKSGQAPQESALSPGWHTSCNGKRGSSQMPGRRCRCDTRHAADITCDLQESWAGRAGQGRAGQGSDSVTYRRAGQAPSSTEPGNGTLWKLITAGRALHHVICIAGIEAGAIHQRPSV